MTGEHGGEPLCILEHRPLHEPSDVGGVIAAGFPGALGPRSSCEKISEPNFRSQPPGPRRITLFVVADFAWFMRRRCRVFSVDFAHESPIRARLTWSLRTMPTLMARVLLMHYGGLFAATAAGACGCSRDVGPLNNAGGALRTRTFSHQKREYVRLRGPSGVRFPPRVRKPAREGRA